MVFHSGIAQISLVQNDVFSHLKADHVFIVIFTSGASQCEAYTFENVSRL